MSIPPPKLFSNKYLYIIYTRDLLDMRKSLHFLFEISRRHFSTVNPIALTRKNVEACYCKIIMEMNNKQQHKKFKIPKILHE